MFNLYKIKLISYFNSEELFFSVLVLSSSKVDGEFSDSAFTDDGLSLDVLL